MIIVDWFMVKTRKILVVTLVATLLGAGRIACAAPGQNGPAMAQLTSRLIARLSSKLSGTVRRGLATTRVYQTPGRSPAAIPTMDQRPIASDQTLSIVHISLCPFHFRLPPPIA